MCQKQGEQCRVIAYASTSFAAAQTNYSTIEKELAALRWGVKTFRSFLMGVEFVIHTDHQPLIYLHNMRLIDSRLARTLEDLADFHFQIRYTPGRDNAAADCLSRLYDPDNVHLPGQQQSNPGSLPEGLFLVKEVSGGGDSLFDSLYTLLSREKLLGTCPQSSLKLRELLVGELLEKPLVYGLTLNRAERRKLRLMQYPGQLPGVEVLFAFGRLFGCVVYVHYGGHKPVAYFPPSGRSSSEPSRVHLQCLSGIHYNPVHEMHYFLPPDVVDNLEVASDHKVSYGGPVLSCRSEDLLSDEEEPEVLVVCSEVQFCPVDWCTLHERTHMSSLMVKLGDTHYCALIDTGAQVSCISQSLFRTLDLSLNTDVRFVIAGFGANNSPTLGVVDLTVGLPGAILEPLLHNFVVVEDRMMPFCVILGADYLLVQQVDLDFASKRYLQKGEPIPGQLMWTQGEVAAQSSFPLQIKFCRLSSQTRRVCIGTVGDDVDFEVARDSENNVTCLKSLITRDQIVNHQSRSKLLRALKRRLVSGQLSWLQSLAAFKRYRQRITLSDGVLLYTSAEGHQAYVIDFSLMVEVLLVVHYEMAHVGRQKLLDLVRRCVWNPGLSRVAGEVTSSCDCCQRLKVSPIIAPPIHKISTLAPFELVAMDLVALPPSSGHIACLVVMDHHTKWLSAVAIKSKTTSAVAAAFEHRVLAFLPHWPVRVLTDNGPEFVGEKFNSVLQSYGIAHQYTTPNKPSSNGLVERANRTLLELLRLQATDPSRWYDVLPRALIVHNTTYHSALRQSPTDFIYQNKHNCRGRLVLPIASPEEWREGHPSFGSFKHDQLVLRKVVFRGRETVNKFSERFEGPYSVHKINANGITYIIKHCDSGQEVRAHHSQLKSYRLPPLYIANHPYYLSLKKLVETDSNLSQTSASGCDSEFYFSPEFSDDSESVGSDSLPLLGSEHQSPARSFDRVSPVDFFGFEGREYLQNLVHLSGVVPLWDEKRLLPFLQIETKSPDDLTSGVDEQLILRNSGSLPSCSNLPTMEELPSGIVVETGEEFWDVSDIECVDESQEEASFYGFENSSSDLLEEGLDLLNLNIDLLQSALVLEESVFSGFSSESELEGTTGSVVLETASSVKLRSLREKMDKFRCFISDRRRQSRSAKYLDARGLTPSPVPSVRTRSHGAVQDLPNVQQETLEYKKTATIDEV